MQAAEALNSYEAMIGEVGEPVIVRRYDYSVSPAQPTDRTVQARVMGFAPRDLVGEILQGDRRVICLADALADLLPLVKSDKIVVRGQELSIQSIDDSTRRIGGTLIALDIVVRGG